MRLSSTGAKTTSARQNKKLGKPGFVVRLIFSLAHFLQRLDHALSNRDQIVKIAHRVSTPGKRAHIQQEPLFAMLGPAQQPALAIAQRHGAGRSNRSLISPAPPSYYPCAKNGEAARKRQQRPQRYRPQSHPSAIPPPTLEELASVFDRSHVPVIVFACDAESDRDQLTVSQQLEEAAVRTRLSKKTVELCGFDHLCDTSLSRVQSNTRRQKERD